VDEMSRLESINSEALALGYIADWTFKLKEPPFKPGERVINLYRPDALYPINRGDTVEVVAVIKDNVCQSNWRIQIKYPDGNEKIHTPIDSNWYIPTDTPKLQKECAKELMRHMYHP
jgi:hypothetical protein